MKILPVGCLSLACVLAAATLPAHAQDTRETISLQNQILELRQEVQQLRDQISRLATQGQGGSALGGGYGYQTPPPASPGGAAPGDITAQLLSRVQRIEDEMRTLRGRVDEAENAQQRDSAELHKEISDLNFKLDNGAGAAAAPGTGPALRPAPGSQSMSPPPGNLGQVPAGGATAAVIPPPPAPPPAVKRTAEMILQEGNTALARKDYTSAETAAKAVIAAGGPRATDAQYLLARSLYGARDYAGAAVAYDDTYNRSRSGVHAQEALIGLAASLTAIQEKKAACQTLEKLAQEFPSPRLDVRAQANTVRHEAGCK